MFGSFRKTLARPWNDTVDVTVFLTNVKKDFAIHSRLYADILPDRTNQIRRTVEVTALPTPIAIELKVITAVG